MKLSENSTLSELIANDATKRILEKHFPGFMSHPQLGMAKGFSLKVVASFPQANIRPEQLRAVSEDLAKIEA